MVQNFYSSIIAGTMAGTFVVAPNGFELVGACSNCSALADIKCMPIINFLCFIEAWEHEAIKKQSAANEFRLIQKYKGALFFDDDDVDDDGGGGKIFKIIESNVEWKKKDKNDKETPCYCVLAKPSY